MEKVTKKTTVVGFADALKQTLDIISKKMNEQQATIIELERMIGQLKGDQYLTDDSVYRISRRVAQLEKDNPTLLDK